MNSDQLPLQHALTPQMVRPIPGVAIRRMWPSDVPFVANSWLRSHPGNAHRHRPTVMLLLDRALVKLVMCDDNDPSHIMAWLVAGPVGEGSVPVVHYAFTKFGYRDQGLFTHLLRAAMAIMGTDLEAHRKGVEKTLVHSFCGPRSDDPEKPSAFQALEKKYELRYDPHALLGVWDS